MVEFFVSVASKVPVWGLIVAASCFVILGDFAGKAWSEGHREIWYWTALLSYFLSGFFYIPALLREGIVTTSIFWSVLSVAGFLFIGFVLFKETVTVWQGIGVALGIASVMLLSIGK